MCSCSGTCAECATITTQKGEKGDPGASIAGVTTPSGPTYTLGSLETGVMLNFAAPTGLAVTLPTAPADGTYYEITVTKDVTSNSYDILTGSGDTFSGSLFAMKSGDYPAFSKPTSTDNKISMNGSTTGGLVGTNFRLVYSSRKWIVSGNTYGSGTLASSFSTV